ncbi:hypothetical protein J6590_055120 [Homalodisca vitripennis]|nr:hypothetical protein J6590_055120 [Homalodisca vitripennis]
MVWPGITVDTFIGYVQFYKHLAFMSCLTLLYKYCLWGKPNGSTRVAPRELWRVVERIEKAIKRHDNEVIKAVRVEVHCFRHTKLCRAKYRRLLIGPQLRRQTQYPGQAATIPWYCMPRVKVLLFR